ncbi:hypothetical protein [Nocardioides sp.]|uniref:hypothetical protein n=1 Tax=Nocardioides sp. TaxID=35761 RepID=UPI003511735E
MGGPQESRFRAAVQGAAPGTLSSRVSRLRTTASALEQVSRDLETLAAKDETIGGQTGPALGQSLRTSSARMVDRSLEVRVVATSILEVADLLEKAQNALTELDTQHPMPSHPGPYRAPVGPATPDSEQDRIRHDNQVKSYESTLATRERISQQWADKLDETMQDQVVLMKRIHGEPDPVEPTDGGPGGTGGTGGTGGRLPGGRPEGPVGGRPPVPPTYPTEPPRPPTIPVAPITPTPTIGCPGGPGEPTAPTPQPPTGTPQFPTPGGQPGTVPPSGVPVSTGGTGAVPPSGLGSTGAIVGGAGAAATGAGVVAGLRGNSVLPGGVSSAGGTTPARAIGSSSRTAGSGTLGARGGSGVSGTGTSGTRAAGRGAAAAGSGGRSGGRGAGSGGRAGARAGGRGGAGAGGAAGRGGRRREDDERLEDRDLVDDGRDWVDDEGAPEVLG